jgi:hypothetical protein
MRLQFLPATLFEYYARNDEIVLFQRLLSTAGGVDKMKIFSYNVNDF